jgi:RUN and FYVE domain-containing protein 1
MKIAMKNEMEVAMKLLEKDTDQKEDTIASLRRQLDDVQGLNMDMFQKLQVK